MNRPKDPIDPVVNSIIMKCFERDPIKRLDVKGIIKYQDSLEMITYGDYVSQNNFEKIFAESQIRSEVVQRAIYDTREIDYTNKSLDLRNNPWFFSKSYSFTDRPKDGNYANEDKKPSDAEPEDNN